MGKYPRTCRALVTAGYIISVCAGLVFTAEAQVGSFGGAGSSGGQGGPSLPPVGTDHGDVFARPGTGAEGLPLGNWLVFPSAFAGAVFDSNINPSPSGPSSAGLRLTPSLLAATDDGIRKTTLYGMADARIYANRSSNSPSAISAQAGATETYKPFPDLIVNAQGDFTRQQDVFSTLGTNNSVTTLNPTGNGLAPTANGQSYNQLSGLASVQKNFARAFAIVSGSVVEQDYDSQAGGTSPTLSSPNGVVYTGTGRGGFWITPDLYGYIEGSLDKRDYGTNTLSSTGYRTVVGIGSDQIGLLRGELYGGYQAESYNSAGIGTAGGPVLGARGYYFPLPELTLSVSVDETIGTSLGAVGSGSSTGTSTKVTTFLSEAKYSLAQEWTASGRAGYVHTGYVGTIRQDDAWIIGETLTYSVWQNFGLTFDYQHTNLSSNVPLQGYMRDVMTIGVTYRY